MVAITFSVAIVALLSPLVSATVVVPHGAEACPEWCAANFNNDADCSTPAGSNEGPCFQCGPAALDPNLALCSGTCVNMIKDAAHCGGCGIAVGDGHTCCNGISVDTQNSDVACGGCGHLVPEGETCCAGGPVNLLDAHHNCGACGSACAENQVCTNGACA